MIFFGIRHLKSSNAVFVSRPKKYFETKYPPFFASESGKRYSANVSQGSSIDIYNIRTAYSLDEEPTLKYPPVCRNGDLLPGHLSEVRRGRTPRLLPFHLCR